MLITDRRQLREYYSDKRVWQGIPGIECTAKGILYATFYSGNVREGLGNYCALLRSTDGGSSWSEPVAVRGGETVYRYYDPCLWLDPLGRLWWFCGKGPDQGVWACVCDDPEQQELHWGEERFIAHEVMMNKPTVLENGDWLLPIAVWDNQLGTALPHDMLKGAEKTGAYVWRSSDNGKTFTRLGAAVAPLRCFDEHAVVELRSGVLYMIIRNYPGLCKSYSYDKGLTWSLPQGFELPNPCTRPLLRRLRSGRLLLVNNTSEWGKRTNLTAYLSEDDGATWPWQLLLDDRMDISYPDLAEAADGTLYIIYDRERGGYQPDIAHAQQCAREILMAQIREQDILDGKLTQPGSRLAVIVSKLGDYTGDTEIFRPVNVYEKEEMLDFLRESGDTEELLRRLFVWYAPNWERLPPEDAVHADTLLDRFLSDGKDGALAELIDLLHAVPDETYSTQSEIPHWVTELFRQDGGADLRSAALQKGISYYWAKTSFRLLTGVSAETCRNALFGSKEG